MYHGTSSSNARSILQGGFRPSSGGMLGPGVYCSRDINKARNYGDTVIRVRVDVGRVKVIDCASDRDSSWQSGAYDTAWVKPGVQPSGEEDCVKNPNRIDVLGIAEGSRPDTPPSPPSHRQVISYGPSMLMGHGGEVVMLGGHPGLMMGGPVMMGPDGPMFMMGGPPMMGFGGCWDDW